MVQRELRGVFLRILAGVVPLTLSFGLSSCGGSSTSAHETGSPTTPEAGTDDPCASLKGAPGGTCASGAYCVALDPGVGATPDADGRLPQEQCHAICGDTGILSCEVVAPADGAEEQRLVCHPNCTGRAPDGLARCPQADGLGGYFAEMARLEAASVVAFRRLAHELRRHGAPRGLRRAARRAARDEVRHARHARDLSLRFGGAERPPVIAPARTRSLFELLRENAAEGVVREAFGALAAGYQARVARDPAIRRVMKSIAADETRHAELALRIERWAARGLAEDERRALSQTRRAAVASLFAELEREPPQDIAAMAGAPSRAAAKELAGRLEVELWNA
jgi:hypothetical protein